MKLAVEDLVGTNLLDRVGFLLWIAHLEPMCDHNG